MLIHTELIVACQPTQTNDQTLANQSYRTCLHRLRSSQGGLEQNDQGETIRVPRSAAALSGISQKPLDTD